MTRRRQRSPIDGLLGSLEHLAMQALWFDAPATVGTVRSRVNADRPEGDGLAYTTIMTVLGRLHDKGLVEREKVGRGFSYRPAFDEDGLVEHLGRQEVDDLVGRYGQVALAQFAAALAEVEPETLERIRRLAEERRDE